MDFLPHEILLQILRLLTLDARVKLSLCSWRLRSLACDRSLYAQVAFKHQHLLGPFLGSIVPPAGVGIVEIDLTSLGSFFSDEHLAQIARWCPSLKILSVSGTGVTDRGLKYLAGLISFTPHEVLSHWATDTDLSPSPPPAPSPPPDDSLQAIQKRLSKALTPRCPGLNRLAVSKLRGMTNVSLYALAAALGNLTHLDMSHCPNTLISSGGLGSLVSASHNLTSLNVSGCAQLDDDSILAIAFANCRNTITHLDASGCHRFSSSAVRCILTSCSVLQVLSLEYCWRVGDDAFIDMQSNNGFGDSLIPILISSVNFRRLSLSFCYTISDLTVMTLLRLRGLEHVDLFNTAVSDDAKETLISRGVSVGKVTPMTHLQPSVLFSYAQD